MESLLTTGQETAHRLEMCKWEGMCVPYPSAVLICHTAKSSIGCVDDSYCCPGVQMYLTRSMYGSIVQLGKQYHLGIYHECIVRTDTRLSLR